MQDTIWKQKYDNYTNKLKKEARHFSVHGRSRLHYTQLFGVGLTENQAIQIMKNIFRDELTKREFKRSWVQDDRNDHRRRKKRLTTELLVIDEMK